MVELEPFDPALAALVSTWARTPAEAHAWCAHDDVPVPPELVAGWCTKPDVTAYGLRDGTDLVGYGELWVDDEESEVELAHLIVIPQRRGQGVGRHLARSLAEHARVVHPTVLLRVHPDNEAAARSYAAAGFRRVSADEVAAWNERQPVAYLWMRYAVIGSS